MPMANIVKVMEIIYHERKPNYLATIKAMAAGDVVVFPWNKMMCEPSHLRTLCSKQPGEFTVNKTDEGMRVTRTA